MTVVDSQKDSDAGVARVTPIMMIQIMIDFDSGIYSEIG